MLIKSPIFENILMSPNFFSYKMFAKIEGMSNVDLHNIFWSKKQLLIVLTF